MPFMLKAARDGYGTPFEERLPELEFIATRLRAMHGAELGWAQKAVKSYVVLSLEFLKLQKLLEQTGRYLYSSERETHASVYQNEEVFGGYYLPGLLLSEALWPNHHRLAAGLRDEFFPLIPANGKVLEVGVGSGYHLAELMRSREDVRYDGFDISRFAIDFAERFALDSAQRQRASFVLGDAVCGIDVPEASYDAIICGEVLEHVDDPGKLMSEFRRILKPRHYAFITTVIFAANIDHVFMFEDAVAIREFIVENGWSIVRDWVLPIYAQDSPEARKRPMNYGAIVTPR